MQSAVLSKDVDTINGLITKGTEVQVEGLWNEITGGSWMFANGNPAALGYAVRSAVAGLPIDDKVFYVKFKGLGYLIHESEIQF